MKKFFLVLALVLVGLWLWPYVEQITQVEHSSISINGVDWQHSGGWGLELLWVIVVLLAVGLFLLLLFLGLGVLMLLLIGLPLLLVALLLFPLALPLLLPIIILWLILRPKKGSSQQVN